MAATQQGGALFALLTEFESPSQFMHACEKVRDAGFKHWDAHSPFPVHGMDDAMGIRGTRLPWLVLVGGLSGLSLGALMQWWMNAVDYPYMISGKPMFGLPAAVPVIFELTVLLSAFACFFGMWGLNGMPRLSHPLLAHDRFRRASQDRFYIVIEARDPRFEIEKTRAFLASLGGSVVDEVRESVEG
jgi:hypothetical protein